MSIFGKICLILGILALLWVITGVYLDKHNREKADIVFATFIGIFLPAFAMFLVGITTSKSVNPIPGIDVYCGDTVLQITFKDDIPIGSVVIYKTKDF